MTLFGIDISNHQRDFNFGAAAAEGYSFATHKVTEGDGYRDPYWPRARDEMEKHFPGRHAGYVFCKVGTDPGREADAYFAHGGTPTVQIDYEDLDRNGSGADLARRVEAFRERGAHLLPVYIPRWYWRDRMGSPDLSFLPSPLWNSHYVAGSDYGSRLYPGDDWTDGGSGGWAPFGGKDVAFLQFSEKGRVAGQSIDVNAYRGDLESLGALFNPAAKPSTEEDPLVSLNQEQQNEVLAGAAQWAAPQVTDPSRKTIGPRALLNAEGRNVRTPDGAWGRAMMMDLWNELVFDGYASLTDHDPAPGSLVSFVLRTHKMTADLHKAAGL